MLTNCCVHGLFLDNDVFINCGGPRLSIEGQEYEQDVNDMGPSSFYSNDKWASSTTGDFLGNDRTSFFSDSRGSRDQNIYSTARLAPLSLKYYIRCLRKGSYTLNLHFAEIMLTANEANNTLGRRIFDVYVQVRTQSVF
ncbi:hypothetical protein ACHQM5_018273 [Ranunculus cassubicifolius]